MKLYFLRHGKADWPDWTRPDDERPLTEKGRKQMRRMADLLRKLEVDPAVILSSPLPRAFETAEIASKRLGLELKAEPALGKGFDLAALRVILTRTKGRDIMIVGHEPTFSLIIRKLTGAKVKLGKAGLARVDLEHSATRGTLVWLLSPKIAEL